MVEDMNARIGWRGKDKPRSRPRMQDLLVALQTHGRPAVEVPMPRDLVLRYARFNTCLYKVVQARQHFFHNIVKPSSEFRWACPLVLLAIQGHLSEPQQCRSGKSNPPWQHFSGQTYRCGKRPFSIRREVRNPYLRCIGQIALPKYIDSMVSPYSNLFCVRGRERRRAGLNHEMSERIEVDTDGASAQGKRFDDASSATHERIQNEIAGARKRGDQLACNCRMEARGIFIEVVRLPRDVVR